MAKTIKLISAGVFALNIAIKSEVIGALLALAFVIWIMARFFGAVFEELERRHGV